jgi:UPF0716 protein FxsA
MSFIGKFFLLVLVVGFGELYLLVKVSANLSFPVTLAICVLTGVVGGALVRHQGTRAWGEIQGSLGRNEAPAETLVSGLVLLMVGVILILPGFITDAVGFLLLIPPLRRQAARWLVAHFEGKVAASQQIHFGPGFGPGSGFGAGPGAGPGWSDEQDVQQDVRRAERKYRQVIDVDPVQPAEPPGDDES